MIEKFLEKFLPQITERLNENEEVGKALIEALAVLDNYATINNVTFTDQQINEMLGVVPEPAPEPNADIPAEIVNIVEKKKRGRKPKTAATTEPTNWTWRFKTEQELFDEFGIDWRIASKPFFSGGMEYLFGQPIAEIDAAKDFIKQNKAERVDTEDTFGITSSEGIDVWFINTNWLTQKPLPTTAAPTTWNWRFKTKEEFIEEYGGNFWYDTNWSSVGEMDYLFGQEIAETPNSRDVISLLQKGVSRAIDTFDELGITGGGDDVWALQIEMLTQKPLPDSTPLKTPTKSGRKPKASSNWNYRFKTKQEFIDYFGDDWITTTDWSSGNYMDYLFGQRIVETPESRKFIKNFEKTGKQYIDTKKILGIASGVDDEWTINELMLTEEPLPNAAAPAKTPAKRGRKAKSSSNWNWRFKTEQEFLDEYGTTNWRPLVTAGVTAWEEDMDYLFGQPIIESDESKEYVERVIEYETGYGFDLKRFGIYRPNGVNAWEISADMIINEPLPTAAAPVKTPAKRGRKPKASSNWNWRFKTEKELREEYGGKPNGSIPVMGSFVPDMFYLFGKPIEENDVSKKFIEDLKNEPYTLGMDTKEIGISNGVKDTYFSISFDMVTNKPLPTAATPAKTPKKRGRKPKSELPEIDLGGLEDIGDIDIDDIDFDNLVI
jgi:hypothetical protein